MAKQNTSKPTAKPKAAKPKAAKPKRTPLTRAQAEAAMKKNAKAYSAYQVERGKGVARAENPHRAGYQAYKQAYRELLEIKRAAGEIKPRAQAQGQASS